MQNRTYSPAKFAAFLATLMAIAPGGIYAQEVSSAAAPTAPLVRIPPEYPPDARARGVKGWVDLEFTITRTGVVKDVVVVAANPSGVFDHAAERALTRWRYAPQAAERLKVRTRITFDSAGQPPADAAAQSAQ